MQTKNLIIGLLIIMSAVAGLTQKQSGGNSSQSTPSPGVSAKTTAENSSQVDALMARWSQGNMPGAAIIVLRDGRALHKKGYGLANLTTKERISSKTVFDIASVSKQFTAMAVMILVERGKLNYADTLSKFFPEFQSDARLITVRQLLNHTSGIMDYTLVWGESKKLKDNAPRTAENVVRFLAGRKQLRFPPGQRWEYSNSNYALLAQIVSRVSGESFPQFVRKNIFQPLGMNDSFVYDKNQTAREGLAAAYVAQGDGFKPADRNPENYVYGDGQVNSTVEDLAKWDQSLYSETLVKASTLKEAFAPGQLNDGTPVNYGFGWGLGRHHGLNFVAHSGGTDGFVAQITRFSEQHFSVILLSNCEQFTLPYAVANKIASIYLAENLKSPAAVQLAPQILSEYVGRYSLYDVVLQITLENSAFWLTPPGQKRVKLAPVSDKEFTIEGSNGTSSIGFNRNSQGRITCLTLLDQNGIAFCRQQ
jgi:CubicO group peptidase (beta-lactamase class C family)